MENIARLHKVLGDATRLRILWLLFNHPELCVCDVVTALDMTQSKASRHLAVLRAAGLVADRKDGTWSHYRLQPVADPAGHAVMTQMFRQLATEPGAARDLRRLETCVRRRDGAHC